jgi:hypothetical protein
MGNSSDITHFYIVCLLASAIYVSCSLGSKLLASRQLHGERSRVDGPAASQRLSQMIRETENLRQFNMLLLLCFGIFFANQTIRTFRAVRFSAMSLSGATADIFVPPTIFALLVFAILTFLHSVQWIVNARLHLKLASISLHEE